MTAQLLTLIIAVVLPQVSDVDTDADDETVLTGPLLVKAVRPEDVIPPPVASQPGNEGITPIEVILDNALQLDGSEVIIAGEFAGPSPLPLSPLARYDRIEGMDLILRDATGELFFASNPHVRTNVRLHPKWSLGVRIVVIGEIRLSPASIPYVFPTGVYRRQCERGAFCALEIMAPDKEHDGAIPIRLIFNNDTQNAIKLMYPSGVTHDLVITKDGVEVWRLSRVWRHEVQPQRKDVGRREMMLPARAQQERRAGLEEEVQAGLEQQPETSPQPEPLLGAEQAPPESAKEAPAETGLQPLAGLTQDLVITKDGIEVWRLSRAAGYVGAPGQVVTRQELVPPARALRGPRETLIPGDSSRVYKDYWPCLDNDGNPVPPGRYQIQGIISRRIYTCPLPIEVPSL